MTTMLHTKYRPPDRGLLSIIYIKKKKKRYNIDTNAFRADTKYKEK